MTRMSHKAVALWMVALAGLAGLAGCQGPGNGVASGEGEPGTTAEVVVAQPYPPIPDVPMPVGFELDESRSWSSGSGASRYADHLYKGSTDKYAVARFFLRQMKANNWERTNEMFLQGRILLDFKKGIENCRIMITDGSLFRPTQVHVTLWTAKTGGQGISGG